MNGVVNDNFNVGLALFPETGSPNNNIDGAYIRFGIRQMTTTNKTVFTSLVSALDQNGDKGNNATFSLAMGEMHRYYGGITSYAGYGKNKSDAGDYVYSGSTRVALAGSPLPQSALPSGATPSPTGSSTAAAYTSPIADGCQKNFIIVVSNGEASDNASSLSTAQTHLTSAQGSAPTTITLTPNGSQGNWSDEYAKFMATGDCNLSIAGTQNVFTYTIDVQPGTTGQGPAHTALLKSMASNGKGKYYAITDISNTTQIEAAFTSIFQEVQSVNSVFASTTLPVSVNVRGTNLNQVYVGVFRPDSAKAPRWFGNLKLYKFSLNTATNELFLSDATGAAAENAATGFVSTGAKSFWTSTSTFWSFRDASLNGSGGSSDSPDGDMVEKGGAAQRLREVYATSHTARSLYTCTSSATSGLCASGDLLSATPFNTTTITPGDLGSYTTYSIASLSSSGTTATATLGAATVTNPAWTTGTHTITVAGATPENYNGTYSANVTSLSPVTFTYTMATAPDATKARMTATNHQLLTGDIIWVTGVSPSGFNQTSVLDMTRVDANNIDYTLGGSVTTSASLGSSVIWGGRTPPLIYGLLGASTANVVMSGHLLTTGTVFANSYVYTYGTIPSLYGGNTTVLNADRVTYPATIPASGANLAVVTASGHPFSSGQTLTISGSTVTGYNVTAGITKIDANTFAYTSSQTTAATNAGIVAGHSISSITHLTTGAAAGRDTATVTTSTAHGFTSGQSITIAGTPGTVAAGTGYNGTWTITAVPTTTTFEIFNSNVDAVPTPMTTAGMAAGSSVTRIDPAIGNTGASMKYWRTLTVTAINALSSATGSITAGRSADGDTTLRDNIVNWVRGADNITDTTDDADLTGVRAGIHADVLHSRPAVINYNRYGNDDDVYAYYGGNDGIFRAVKGGFTSNESGVNPGDERWGFIPKEFFTKLQRLREQTPLISSTNPKGYFWDGSTGVYTKDGNNDGKYSDTSVDKVYLYPAIRRGGNFLYGLDVTTPNAPKLLWRKRGVSSTAADTGWGEVGQLWSEPKVTRSLASLGNTSNPDNVVLIFGAGYDNALDDINPCLLDRFTHTDVRKVPTTGASITYTAAGSCTVSGASGSSTTVSRTKGRGIMVVDAFNGNVIWQAGAAPVGATHNLTVPGMTCAIPSDVAILDKNRDGIGDRAYVGDVCGNVWRVDMSSSNFANWRVTKIAALSGTDDTVITDKLKFLFPPDLVLSTDTSNYTAVLIGAGDREHPFDTTVQNAFFMIKDRDSSDPTTPAMGAENNTTRNAAGAIAGATANPVAKSDLANATSVNAVNDYGWYINVLGGEKNGGGSCGSNLGIARTYLVSFENAAATTDLKSLGTLSTANRSTIVAGGGYLPTPVPAVVDPNSGTSAAGTPYQVVCFGIHCVPPAGTTLNARLRTYWYKEVE